MFKKILVLIISVIVLLYMNMHIELFDATPQKKIVIVGTAKSGTTALYKSTKDAMTLENENLVSFFEPEPEELQKAISTKAKRILVKLSLIDREKYLNLTSNFSYFDKRVMIVRDPRDILISNLLYWVRWMRFSKDEELFNEFLEKLKAKEANPGSISVLELYQLRDRLESKVIKTYETPRTWQDEFRDYAVAVQLAKNSKYDFFIFKYEDYIDERLDEINEYLELKLMPDADVTELKETHSIKKSTKNIARTKNYGNWKNWFTKEDIEVFKPVFEEYMEELGYVDNWEVNKEQYIDPEHSSKYVEKIVKSTNITW